MVKTTFHDTVPNSMFLASRAVQPTKSRQGADVSAGSWAIACVSWYPCGAVFANLEGSAMDIVLVEPEIPQNTGNIARTCACTGLHLHLIEPLGFRLTQRNLARAGCDYWDEVDIVRWPCADAFFEAHGQDELHLFTGQAECLHTDVEYGPSSFLVFGRESSGLDQAILDCYASQCVRIPMRAGLRSLNLSNAVAIAAYEALRQQGFAGLV